MIIRENVPIAELTTIRLGGVARYVVEIERASEAEEAFNFARERNLPVWMMGEGANTIGRDEGFDGVVVLNRIKGIKIQSEDASELIVTAASGESWDDLVKFVVDREYSGIEAMSMIPGTVGAAPVQNIGAYGQDIAQVIVSAEVFDTKQVSIYSMDKSEMRMSYRRTRFNSGEDAGRFWILGVTIRLTKSILKPPFYTSLQRYIDEHDIVDFSPKNIREIVCQIRSTKLPDPKKVASAGSFFKNVYLDQTGVANAEARGIPVWKAADGTGKINSGWLIENCGLKGELIHGMRVSDKAALVLINEGAKGYADLAAARQEIIEKVRAKFGVVLEQEPVELTENNHENA